MCFICSATRPNDTLAPYEQHQEAGASSPAGLGDRFWIGTAPGFERADAPESTATPYSLLIGQSFYGMLSSSADEDWVAVNLVAGQTYSFRLFGQGTSFLQDPFLRLRDASGAILATNDDGFPSGGGFGYGSHGRDSVITFTATSTGTFYLEADAYSTETGGYLLTAQNYDSNGFVFTNDEIAWQLVNNGNAFFGSTQAIGFDLGAGRDLTVNLTALTAEGQNLARHALAAWSAVTGIVFIETAGAAEMTFDDNQAGAFASSISNGTNITSATVNVGTDWLTSFGTSLTSYSFETYIHEIGHALGLAHGGNYNGSAVYGTDNFYLNDSLAWSIMSYMQNENDEFDFGGSGDWNTYVDASSRYIYTPLIADIIAIQLLYGTYNGAFTGNTTYGFGSNTGNVAIDNAVNAGALMAMTIYDNGGIDTLDLSQTNQSQIISLLSESLSSVLGGRHNLGIARGTVIENAIGGNGQDTIHGNDADNRLSGNAGTDILYGGSGNDTLTGGLGSDYLYGGVGIDTVSYLGASSGLRVSLHQASANTGEAAGDFFDSIENLTGSTFNDTLVGNNLANVVAGNSGNDIISGLDGNDTLVGGEGDDTLVGGLGADWLQGGNGIDYASYADATAGVLADLSVPASNSGFAVGDTYSLIEGFIGSGFNDTLLGDNLINTIYGAVGNDMLYGRGGDDTLVGGAGNDTLIGGLGGDLLVGDAGTDFANYGDSTVGLRVDLLTPVTNTGIALGDRYSSIEGIIGSTLNDTLFGDNLANSLHGGLGNDVMNGRDGDDLLMGGAGNDVLIGGLGNDTLNGGDGLDTASYSDSSIALRADLFAPATNTGAAAGDIYLYLENLTGSAHADQLYGDNLANTLTGLAGNDLLNGRGGNDTLIGGLGNDTMIGGAGQDTFYFNAAIGPGNVDVISDFNPVDDTIMLDDAIFTALSLGTLSAAALRLGGAVALTAAHRILYDTTSGRLFYDEDGNGAGAAIHFATMTPGLTLTANDFLIV